MAEGDGVRLVSPLTGNHSENYGGEIPNSPCSSDSRVSPATVRIPSLRMSESRWASTVRALIPSLTPISRFVIPWAMCIRISRSRAVSTSTARGGLIAAVLPSRNAAASCAATSGEKYASPAWTVRIADRNPPTSFRLLVDGTSKLGFMKGEGLLKFTAAGEGTEVSYDGDVQVGGTIAAVGQRLIDATAKLLIKRFFDKLSDEASAPAAN